ncbi:serine hydrolase [Micromonospora sp. WMMD812]|uniref:serine hydrolase n=1 Tax=Micromonospora sp. WMMD812 TaxID=3015152 RepID=UPI00248C95E0|nr:serine hydrolase [Micromonospora sp. WMMD812]WBB68244.1 serine hydrolase [Micromonospora sp. WMMD812]
MVLLAILGGVALFGRPAIPSSASAGSAGTAGPGAGPTGATSATAEAAPSTPPAQKRTGSAGNGAALTAALDALAAPGGAPDFAVAVLDHRTGAAYTFGSHEPFETASVVKVDILAALLLQARHDGRTLTTEEKHLAEVMIRQSDNDAATALWSKIGGAAGLSAADTTFGLTETVPGPDGWWGWTTTTASDQIKLLDVISDPTGPLGESGQLVLDLMGSVVDDQDWGVGAAAGRGESIELKNGWMTRANQGDRWTVNSVGRITGTRTDVTVAVLTRGHTTLSQGIAFVEKIAKLIRAQLDR